MRVDQWTASSGYTLEPNALTAATDTEMNRLLIAGPGAGKTEMLAQRADFLLRTGQCPYPRRILAISFKTDAAANLRRRVADRCGPELAARLDSYTFHAFAKRLIDGYRVVLTGTDALDPDFQVGPSRIARRQITFDDMVPLGTTILETTSVARNAVRNTYSHVFLDEFQDCTRQQYAMLRTAFGPGAAVLTAVGDTKQRIMRWAGALDGIFAAFLADYDAEPLYLYQNFRSAPRLRRVQNAMVKVMDPDAAVPDGDLLGDEGEVAVEYHATASDEAQAVADSVERWINDDGVPPSEIAVLVRQQVRLSAYELMEELRSRGIATRNEQEVQDRFAEPLGQLILDFLSVTIHARQPDAYARLMSVIAPRSDDDEYDQKNAARWRRRIERARRILKDPGGGSQLMVSEVERFLTDVGHDRLVALSPSYTDQVWFDELVGSVLDGLAAMAELADGQLAAMTHVKDDDAVRILTIHKAKGLEFHTVVVLGVENQTFWSSDELANRSELFVAVSRPKQRLVLTVAARRSKPPGADRWDVVRSPQNEFLSYAEACI